MKDGYDFEKSFLALYLKSKIYSTGKTQNEIGHELGIGRSVFNDIVNGKTNPSLSNILKIFNHLNIEMDEYLKALKTTREGIKNGK